VMHCNAEPPPYDNPQADAIRHIGKKGLPFLLNYLRFEVPPWRLILYRSRYSALRCLAFRFADRDNAAARRARGALQAIIVLGADAQDAVGELTEVANGPRRGLRGESTDRAKIALRAIKRALDPEADPPRHPLYL